MILNLNVRPRPKTSVPGEGGGWRSGRRSVFPRPTPNRSLAAPYRGFRTRSLGFWDPEFGVSGPGV